MVAEKLLTENIQKIEKNIKVVNAIVFIGTNLPFWKYFKSYW